MKNQGKMKIFFNPFLIPQGNDCQCVKAAYLRLFTSWISISDHDGITLLNGLSLSMSASATMPVPIKDSR